MNRVHKGFGIIESDYWINYTQNQKPK